ncbi:hypothetical protein BT93_K0453 [Corymbia citriodora subsp. variegata]|nr:hypothetical protein BT93_K0453 [Corymbia citriodora subsp. variegata]
MKEGKIPALSLSLSLSLSLYDQSLSSSSRVGVRHRGRSMSKGIGGLSPWMEVAPALLVPARTRSSRYPGLETIAEDQEAEDVDDK